MIKALKALLIVALLLAAVPSAANAQCGLGGCRVGSRVGNVLRHRPRLFRPFGYRVRQRTVVRARVAHTGDFDLSSRVVAARPGCTCGPSCACGPSCDCSSHAAAASQQHTLAPQVTREMLPADVIPLSTVYERTRSVMVQPRAMVCVGGQCFLQ
jgi:hypothetical protein